jgi:hypothetical protein
VKSSVSSTSRVIRFALLGALVVGATAGTAMAQSKPVTVTAGIDFPSVYFFRGIRQEADPSFTTFLFGDVGVSLLSDGAGALSSAGINVGSWNAFLTGSSGSDGGFDSNFYESDFYASLTLGFKNGVSVTPTFTAYTSPNDAFTTVKELSFKVAHGSNLAPYGLVAFEIGGDDSGQADGGHLHFGTGGKGTYLELGIGPSWPVADGKATVAVPIKLGLSLNDYYEHFDSSRDHKFGYIDGGVLVTVPFGGRWNLHGGVNFLGFGESTKAFNNGDAGQVIGSVGLGFSY